MVDINRYRNEQDGIVVEVDKFNRLPVLTNSFYDISRGLVPGEEAISILGSNPAVGTTLIDLWDPGGKLVYPEVGEQWEILSSSVNDALGGTKAQKMVLQYLDDDYNEQQEIIDLDSTNPVLTVATNFFRHRRSIVIAPGTINEGDITIRVAGGGDIRGKIIAGNGNTLDGHYTIPAGKTAFIVFVYTNISKDNDGEILLRSTNGTDGIFSIRFPLSIYQNSVVSQVAIPAAFTEKSDLKLTAISSNAANKQSAVLQFIEVDTLMANYSKSVIF